MPDTSPDVIVVDDLLDSPQLVTVDDITQVTVVTSVGQGAPGPPGPAGPTGPQGTVATASTAETIAGTDATKAVSPAGRAGAATEFDVRDARFGAKGDGVTDDTAAINAAMSAAGSVKGTVLFPAGTYLHSGFQTPTFVTLRGVGHQTSILRYTGTAVGVTLGVQATLRSLRLESSTPVASSTGIGFALNAARIVIERCMVTGFGIGVNVADVWIIALRECLFDANVTTSVRFSGQTNNVQVRGGEIKGGVNGVLVAGGSNICLDGVAIETCTSYGIRVTSDTPVAHNLVVHGCYFELNGTYDISVDGGGRAFNIVGSHFLSTPTSIRINAGTAVRVEGNFLNPGGGTPKALTLGAFADKTYVGPNAYITGAFNPATDDLGTNTRMVGRAQTSQAFYNPANLSASVGTHVYTATAAVAITAAYILHGTALAVDAVNYWKMTLQKYNSAGVFQGSICALGSDTQAFTANVPVAVPSLDATFRKLAAGDTLKLRWDKTGTPATLNYPSLTVSVQETQTP